MSVEVTGDLRHANLSLLHTCDDEALGEGEMRRHGGTLRSAKIQQMMAFRISE